MALFLIGLGLWNLKDITLEGLELAKAAKRVYVENYTSMSGFSLAELEQLLGRKVQPADRSTMEEHSHEIINAAAKEDVAVLVFGDPLVATTHTELLLEAAKRKILTRIVHNASIFTAVAETGLFLYNFGKTISIPFQARDATQNIETPYRVLQKNRSINAHTLFLLDLNPQKKEFLSIHEALDYLARAEQKCKENIFNEQTLCIGCARLGSSDAKIVAAPAAKLRKIDFGAPPYVLIVPAAELNFKEREALERFAV